VSDLEEIVVDLLASVLEGAAVSMEAGAVVSVVDSVFDSFVAESLQLIKKIATRKIISIFFI